MATLKRMGKIVRENTFDERKKRPGLKFNPWLALIAGGGGTLGYFLGGYVPPGTPDWHPVLKKNFPKIDTPF